MTCGRINDFVSIRTFEECKSALASFAVDVAAYCGCTQDFSPQGFCALCGPGEEVVQSNGLTQPLLASRQQSSGEEEDAFIETGMAAENATGVRATSVPCNQLADFAHYVMKAGLCAALQKSRPLCCRPIDEGVEEEGDAPSSTSNPTALVPTSTPSVIPHINSTTEISTINTTSTSNGVSTVAPTMLSTSLPATPFPVILTPFPQVESGAKISFDSDHLPVWISTVCLVLVMSPF